MSLQLSEQKVGVGETDTITVASTDATSCSEPTLGKIGWSGQFSVTPKAGGVYTYAITCTGAGGSVTQNAVITVPMPVYSTSYENKNDIALDNPELPSIGDISNITPEMGEQGFSPRAVAFADFSQDGSYDTAVVLSSIYKGIYGWNTAAVPDSPAKLYFLKRENGSWTDVTSLFIKDSTTRYTCISPGFIEVADFNGDGKPDFYISCTGVDGNVPDVQYALSSQYVGLSQQDGTYLVSAIPNVTIYSHQAAAADIDGDGNVDIVTVNPIGNITGPIVLWGDGHGNFTADAGRFPADTSGTDIFDVQVVPVEGTNEIILNGPSAASASPAIPNAYGTKVLKYQGGAFQEMADLTAELPSVAQTGLQYGNVFDTVYNGGFFYMLLADGGDNAAIAKVDPSGVGAAMILVEQNRGTGSSTAGIIKLNGKNDFVSEMADCGPSSTSPTSFFYYWCTLNVPLQ